MDEEYIECFSCGAKSLNLEGECHEYMLSSSGCYEMFNEVLNREYSDFRFSKSHHFTVDSYAVQHPGKVSNQKAVNSVGIHLISLYFLFEKKYDITKSTQIKMEFAQFNKENKVIQPIERPEKFKGLTVFEIWENENPIEHFELCKKWAEDSWESWSNHHETIEKWAAIFIKNKN
jgi:hypothetical protein